MVCPKRLLIAEHDGGAPLSATFRPLEALGVQVVTTRTPDETRQALSESNFDILAIDAKSFHEVTRILDRPDQTSHVAILLVADPDDPIPAVVAGRSVRSRLWDLVHRDAPAEELLLRTERLVEQGSTLADLETARYHASHDDLTGLLRPVRFGERLREHFSAAQRHRLEFALVLVDLDRFGQVNKEFDHTVGDELISRVGSVIRMSLRTEDVGARIGGDEFALILPYTQRVDAARVVTRLAGRFRALSGPPPTRFHAGRGGVRPAAGAATLGGSAADRRGVSIAVSASLGFETYNGKDIPSHEEMRQHAERALRIAKTRGGNQAVYYRNLSADEATIAGAFESAPSAGTPPAETQPEAAQSPGPDRPGPVSADEHRTQPVRPIQDEVSRRIDLEH